MYELIILSLLMRGIQSGYLIAQVINEVIGPIAQASNGGIYPLIARLVSFELISEVPMTKKDRRRTRMYRITEKGRERFRELMMNTSSNPREYRDIFAFKVSAFDMIASEQRLSLIEHYQSFCQLHKIHQSNEADEVLNEEASKLSPEQKARNEAVFRHLSSVWELESAWASELWRLETGQGN